MDEIKLKTSFLKRTISKIITRQIKKKVEDGIEICIDDFNLETRPDTSGEGKKVYLVDLTVSGVLTEEALRDLCSKLIGSGTN